MVFASRFSVQFSFYEAIFEGDHDIKKWEDVKLMLRDGGGEGGVFYKDPGRQMFSVI